MKYTHILLRGLFALYVLSLLYVTLLAWNYGASLGPAGPGGRNYNLIPFRSIYRIAVFSPDIKDPIRILLGNVVLFVPLGFFLPAILRSYRRFFPVVIIGFCLSLAIELSQFLFTYRVSNVDDVILNTLGTWTGICLFFILYRLRNRIVIFHL